MDARVCTPATSLCSRGPIRVLKGASTFSPSCKKAVKRGIIISGVIVGILVAIKKKRKKFASFQPPWRVTIRPELSSRASFPNKIRVSRIPDEFPDAIP